MPFANNNGVQIYYEVEGHGPPLVLHHGVSSNGHRWRLNGWVDKLSKNYQVIVVDARGHGQSSMLPDAEFYSIKYFAEDVVTILNERGIEKTNYFGYSLGGFVGLGLVRYFPERLNALVIGGADPAGFLGENWKAADGLRQRYRIGAELGGEAYFEHITELYGANMDQDFSDYLRAKPKSEFQAYVAVLTALLDFPTDLTNDAKSIQQPTLFYVGENEEFWKDFVINGASDYPNVTFKVVPELDHVGAAARSDLVMPIVQDFLSSAKT